MAASRWKRFAFFDRHTLNVPNEVLEDVIPNALQPTTPRNPSMEDDNDNNAISLVVTTAGLPLTTRPATAPLDVGGGSASKLQQQQSSSRIPGSSNNNEGSDSTEPVGAMWSSLVTCSTMNYENAIVGEEMSQSIPFPAKGSASGTSAAARAAAEQTPKPTAMDGLVLAFLSSPETDFVHCMDVTVRCNPPQTILSSPSTSSSSLASATNPTTDTAAAAATTTTSGHPTERDLEDLDGWRGYLCPFSPSGSNNGSEQQDHTIRGLAICRLKPVSSSTSTSTSTFGNGAPQQHCAVHLCCLSRNRFVVWEDPHLFLSCRRPLQMSSHIPPDAKLWHLVVPANIASASSGGNSGGGDTAQVDGDFCTVSMIPGVVAVGTTNGAVLIYIYNPLDPSPSPSPATARGGGSAANKNKPPAFRRYLRIPPPLTDLVRVVTVKVSETTTSSGDLKKMSVFVVYNRQSTSERGSGNSTGSGACGTTAGICCYDMPVPSSSAVSITAPSARHDLDGRHVSSPRLVDATFLGPVPYRNARLTVARPDGLYTYSQTERTNVSPIDGNKLTVAIIPQVANHRHHHIAGSNNDNTGNNQQASNHHNHHRRPLEALDEATATLGYALLASTDEKSGRDAVDVYDSTNKLVAFHLLLSPGHRAVRAAGVATPPTICSDGSIKGGRSSALVFTSGGSLVTLTEKRTSEKVDLLVKKNLYSAAVVVAYSDPSYPASAISVLYRRYAEHLYRKGDLSGAVDQYIHTIGSLESSHVIFRFLDAPKIPLLVKYLNQLRERGQATPVHDELLRTCYLKLNDAEAAEAIASSSNTVNRASLTSVLSNLTANPKEALSIICSLEPSEAADILVIHGASLARLMPQETGGVVVSLCTGTFKSLARSSSSHSKDLKEMLEMKNSDGHKSHEPYPVELFASSFIEQPKMLRLILSLSNNNKCPLTPSLRRTLLELTLNEWNQAKRTGDTEALKLRHKEAIAALTDSHAREIGDYDALVICQLAGFEEGQLLLYERLQMTPVLLERYAKDGSEKARRQMLAMCQSDPDILPDVLGYFVAMVSERLNNCDSNMDDEGSYTEDTEELLDDIQATLALARRQGASPPVRIARILAGEGTGQFSSKPNADSSSSSSSSTVSNTVPLSVALDYVGTILEESRHEGARLKAEVEEYNELCNSMEREIESLLRTSRGMPPLSETEEVQQPLNIDELYTKIRQEGDSSGSGAAKSAVDSSFTREAFWREMNQSEGDSLETIARFFAKGVIR